MIGTQEWCPVQVRGLLSLFAEQLTAQAPQAAKACSAVVREVAGQAEAPAPLVSHRRTFTLPASPLQGEQHASRTIYKCFPFLLALQLSIQLSSNHT